MRDFVETDMPQLHLPLFPDGATEITASLSFSSESDAVTYFCTGMPIFSHAQNDRASFLVSVAQLHVTCGAKQADLARAFGIPTITVKRAVKLFRSGGAPAFYAQRAYRGAAVLTDTVLANAQSLLDSGCEPKTVALELGIKFDTFSKAIRAGRLHYALKKSPT